MRKSCIFNVFFLQKKIKLYKNGQKIEFYKKVIRKEVIWVLGEGTVGVGEFYYNKIQNKL